MPYFWRNGYLHFETTEEDLKEYRKFDEDWKKIKIGVAVTAGLLLWGYGLNSLLNYVPFPSPKQQNSQITKSTTEKSSGLENKLKSEK